MNEALIADLKLFIASTVSQQIAGLRTEVVTKIDRLEHKVDDLSVSIGEVLENTQDRLQTQLDDHDRRITQIERTR